MALRTKHASILDCWAAVYISLQVRYMTMIEPRNKVYIFFPGHGMQSACKLTLKLHVLIIKKQSMKTK